MGAGLILTILIIVPVLLHEVSKKSAERLQIEQLKETLTASTAAVVENNKWLTLSAEKEEYSPGETVFFNCINHTQFDIILGFDTIIEIELDNNWYVLPNQLGSTSLGAVVHGQGDFLFKFTLSEDLFDWISGHYRILKVLPTNSSNFSSDPNTYITKYIAVDFRVHR